MQSQRRRATVTAAERWWPEIHLYGHQTTEKKKIPKSFFFFSSFFWPFLTFYFCISFSSYKKEERKREKRMGLKKVKTNFGGAIYRQAHFVFFQISIESESESECLYLICGAPLKIPSTFFTPHFINNISLSFIFVPSKNHKRLKININPIMMCQIFSSISKVFHNISFPAK